MINPEDGKVIVQIFNEGFEQVVLPYIARMQQDIAIMKTTLEDHSFRLDRIERKLNAVVDQQDEQGIEIKKIKDKLA